MAALLYKLPFENRGDFTDRLWSRDCVNGGPRRTTWGKKGDIPRGLRPFVERFSREIRK